MRTSTADINVMLENVTRLPEFINFMNSRNKDARELVDGQLTAALAFIGTVGNFLYMLLLIWYTKRRCVQGHQDRGTHVGLLLLASSDLLFCISLLPRSVIRSELVLFTQLDFVAWYQCYCIPISSTLILTSTWITMTIAILRYLGICHPFLSRRLVAPLYTHIMYAGVILLAVVASSPMFLMTSLVQMVMPDNTTLYTMAFHWPDLSEPYGGYYMWPRLVFGTLLPTAVLIFCNGCLVRTLRQSRLLHSRSYVHDAARSSRPTYRTSVTLITVAIAYLVLVFPAELCDFIIDIVGYAPVTETVHWLRSICNILQTLNFAFNFFFYAVVNANLRGILQEARNLKCSELFSMKWPSDRQQLSMLHPTTSSMRMTRIDYKT